MEDDDFFDRPGDVDRLRRELANGGNLLLVAPRRVGKTSLVLRICELERQANRAAVFFDVEGCPDELAFAEKLVDAIRETGFDPEPLTKLSLVLRKARQALGGMRVGAAGVNMEMGSPEDPDLSTLGRAIESVFRRVEAQQTPLLIAIDEMPELLLAMSSGAQGAERVAAFLHWLRSLRQTYRKYVRWIFLGSIGLDTFVDNHQLRKTINDLTTVGLDALSVEEAHTFLFRLGEGTGIGLSDHQRTEIIARVGWPLPHHLQIAVHAIIDCGVDCGSPSAINAAFEHLLSPLNIGEFDTWRHRLNQQFDRFDSDAAKQVLRVLCQAPDGHERDSIFNALMSSRPGADPAAVDEQLSKLLMMLQRDGYILKSGNRYAFRSFLLRDYWYRRDIA